MMKLLLIPLLALIVSGCTAVIPVESMIAPERLLEPTAAHQLVESKVPASPESKVVGKRDELVAAGTAIYLQQYCGVCHQLDAIGTSGTFGPDHANVGNLAEERIHDPTYSGTATTAADYLYESLVAPDVYIVPGYTLTPHQMPAYTHLPEEELRALVVMLLAQRSTTAISYQ